MLGPHEDFSEERNENGGNYKTHTETLKIGV